MTPCPAICFYINLAAEPEMVTLCALGVELQWVSSGAGVSSRAGREAAQSYPAALLCVVPGLAVEALPCRQQVGKRLWNHECFFPAEDDFVEFQLH